MGTKTNPGQIDCYAAAEDDEPIFVLRANDPIAPKVILYWASLYDHNHPNRTADQLDKLTTALMTAEDMAQWKIRRTQEEQQVNG